MRNCTLPLLILCTVKSFSFSFLLLDSLPANEVIIKICIQTLEKTPVFDDLLHLRDVNLCLYVPYNITVIIIISN